MQLKQKNKITVGADSRVANLYYNTRTRIRTETYTDSAGKIVSNGKLGIAISGSYGAQCIDEAKKALLRNKTFIKIKNDLMNIMPNTINQYLMQFVEKDTSVVNSQYPINRTISNIIIFGTQGDSLIYV
ncbi:MAG: hypothetical protein J0H74_33075 [Chitinophagaceae bacterium]|nr:hypothetical protein [Chitinophagaceae bacterium]